MGFRRWRRGLTASLFVLLFARLGSAQPSTPTSDDGPAVPAPEVAPPAVAPAAPGAPTAPEPPPVPAPSGPAPHLRTDGWIAPDMPKTRPYYPGAPTPPGYQFESTPRWGFIVPGTILFTLGYSIAIALALEPEYRERYWLFVPVVGPMARILAEKINCDAHHSSEYCDAERIDAGPEIAALLFQVPGATFLVAGILSPRKRFVRNDLASLEVIPIAIRGGGGLRVVGRF